MKKLFLGLGLIAVAAQAKVGNVFVQQVQPSTQELQRYFNDDYYFLEGVRNAFFVPQNLNSSLERAFKNKAGKMVLEQIRSYNKPALDDADRNAVKAIIKKSSLSTTGVGDYALVSDKTDHVITIPLRGISERQSPSDIFNPIVFQQQMVSSIPAWLKIKRIIEQEGLDKLVKIPSHMYAWHYGNLLRPKKDFAQFSDRDYVVVYTPVDQLDLQSDAGKKHRETLMKKLSITQVNALETLIDKGGLWSMNVINFDKNGTMVITSFQQPDNTVSAPNMGMPGVFYGNSITKRAFNRYAGFDQLASILPAGPVKARIVKRSKEAFELYEHAKKIEAKELDEAYDDMNEEFAEIKKEFSHNN